MLNTRILSSCETLVFDHTEEKITKWKKTIRDRRKIKDLGDSAINIFGLDEIYIEPLFLSAKSFLSGTTSTTKFRLILTNGDRIKFTATEIIGLHERDSSQRILQKNSILINDELIDVRDYGIRGRYATPEYMSLDFVRDFYFNYWIPARNEEN